MAGTNPAFNADVFRNAVRDTMLMGLPENVADRATFRWRTSSTYAEGDLTSQPYSWDEAPASTISRPDVQIPVAVEFGGSVSRNVTTDTSVGQFDVTKAALTILDIHYPLVEGADLVLLGGNTYTVSFVAPPVGLFDVTIYTVYIEAMDET